MTETDCFLYIGRTLAYCLSDSGSQLMFSYYLRMFREANPSVDPRFFLTDKDMSQINAIEAVFSTATVLLCWWHVIEAWKKQFPPARHCALWKLLYRLLYEENQSKFDTLWTTMTEAANGYDDDKKRGALTCAPCIKNEGIKYLKNNWMALVERKRWSAVFRSGRHYLSRSNTTGLMEA